VKAEPEQLGRHEDPQDPRLRGGLDEAKQLGPELIEHPVGDKYIRALLENLLEQSHFSPLVEIVLPISAGQQRDIGGGDGEGGGSGSGHCE
jgi:hypothetical protein